MTLAKVREVYSYYGYIHIATERGYNWIYSGPNEHFPSNLSYLESRQVIHIYRHEGREESQTCRPMHPGIAIIIEGTENGTI